MKNSHSLAQRWLVRSLGLAAASTLALISACGGGGSVSIGGNGSATPVPTATSTPLPFAVLHTFAGGSSDGARPNAALVADSAGNFYGTTTSGGTYSYGTVFKITTSGGFTLLHSFDGDGSDGANPYAGLISNGAGNFYGTTEYGGASGYGTVYKITSAGVYTLLHSLFSSDDGAFPNAGLITDGAGNFYGTTQNGGAYGKGTIFRTPAQ